jgi:hypothetical protein
LEAEPGQADSIMDVQYPQSDINATIAGRHLSPAQVNFARNQTVAKRIPTPSVQKQKAFSTPHVWPTTFIGVPEVPYVVEGHVVALENVARPDVPQAQDVGLAQPSPVRAVTVPQSLKYCRANLVANSAGHVTLIRAHIKVPEPHAFDA